MLERLGRALDRERAFAADAAHELRTPLTVLSSEIELALSRPRSAAELTATLISISEEAQRLLTLADDLLILARTDAEPKSPPAEPFLLRPLLDAIAALQARADVAAGDDLANGGADASLTIPSA